MSNSLTTDTRWRSRAGPPLPVKPPHLKRLSFPRPTSQAGLVSGSFDSANQASSVLLESACEHPPGSMASTIQEVTARSFSASPRSSCWDEVDGLEAWALWSFEGTEPSEISSVAQHALIRCLSLEHSDGWSLIRFPSTGEIGLMPRSYLSFDDPARSSPLTSEMLLRTTDIDAPLIQPSPAVYLPETFPSPVAAQVTAAEGTISKMVRRSLFQGRTINRFSSFVSSGAEAFIQGSSEQEFESGNAPTPASTSHARLRSTDSDLSIDDHRAKAWARGVSEADLHFIDFGPAWKAKTPPFDIAVHSPQKRKSLVGLSDYTIYLITSVFPAESPAVEGVSEVTVERRFSNFIWLAQHLAKKFSGLALPPLPEKGLTGRFAADFVETRRGDLERWLRRIARHPIIRYSDALVTFLGAEDEEEWNRACPALDEDQHMGPLFYANIFHPSFSFDLEDAQDVIDRFENHVLSADKGTQALREIVAKLREAQKDQGDSRRLFALHLFALIRSKQVGGTAAVSIGDDVGKAEAEWIDQKGLLNADGAWCFRDDCEGCLQVTTALQSVAELLAEIGDLEAQHADKTMLKMQEALKDVAHPSSLYAPVIETHRTTIARYVELLAETENPSDDTRTSIAAPFEAAGRADTILNSTLAEINEYHDAKTVDFSDLTSSYLNAEIAHHEAVLVKLRAARAAFESSEDAEGRADSRRPSLLDGELANPPQRLRTDLQQPSAHPLDSLVRPVTAAALVLNESVSRVWSALPATGGGRRLSRWLW